MQVRDREFEFSVARGMAESFREHVVGETVEETMAGACRLALKYVPRSEWAGISLAERSGLRSVGATGEPARFMNDLFVRCGQGPVFDVIGGAEYIVVADLALDTRWPELAAAVITGSEMRSELSLRLDGGEHALAALNLYSSQRSAFDDGPAVTELALLLAAQTSIALRWAHEAQNLRAALATRETISVAMGILMGRQNVSREEAFEILRRASQRENRKIRDIAARLAGPVPPLAQS
jgi:ANTAR domain